ncbi:MAG: polysaccharide biosynthesis/export family protein [Paludibacter sp.]|jgi:polysaccharide export outer membrane protein|nr:polysaccharide biosynthesis/export family protein [Paludibacter sp.]
MQSKFFLFLIGSLFFCSCASWKQVSYFQDIKSGDKDTIAYTKDITLKPFDKVSVIVNSKDPLLAAPFNLPIISSRVGSSGTGGGTLNNYNNQVSGYTVDAEGNIDFPVLGKIQVAGMNRDAVAQYIKNELILQEQIKDPVITIEFMNLSVSVLGEVSHPGRYTIDRDKFSILDAISVAGDLTINGKRANILVMRETNGVQTAYYIDLTSGKDIYSSPAFYLLQNDVIYVEPNDKRKRDSTVNGNNVISAQFWISITSLLATVTNTAFVIYYRNK